MSNESRALRSLALTVEHQVIGILLPAAVASKRLTKPQGELLQKQLRAGSENALSVAMNIEAGEKA